MHLIKNDVAEIAHRVITAFRQLYNMPVNELYDVEVNQARMTEAQLRDYSETLDFGAAGWIAAQSKTFI